MRSKNTLLLFLLLTLLLLAIPSNAFAVEGSVIGTHTISSRQNPRLWQIDDDVWGMSGDISGSIFVNTFSVDSDGNFTDIDNWHYTPSTTGELSNGVLAEGSTDVWVFTYQDKDANIGRVFTLNISTGGGISQADDSFLDSEQITTSFNDSEEFTLDFLHNSAQKYVSFFTDSSQNIRRTVFEVQADGNCIAGYNQSGAIVAGVSKPRFTYAGSNYWIISWVSTSGTYHAGLTSVYIAPDLSSGANYSLTTDTDATIAYRSNTSPIVITEFGEYPTMVAFGHEYSASNFVIETVSMTSTGTLTLVDTENIITDGTCSGGELCNIASGYGLLMYNFSNAQNRAQNLYLPSDGSLGIDTKYGNYWALTGSAIWGSQEWASVYSTTLALALLALPLQANDVDIYMTESYFPPVVDTVSVTGITETSAYASAELTSCQTSCPSTYGFCWNTTGYPTVSGSKTATSGAISEGATWSDTIPDLDDGTTYYLRAYATSDVTGTGYGDQLSFTTIIGYNTPVGSWTFEAEDISWVSSGTIADHSVNGNYLSYIFGDMNSNLTVEVGSLTQVSSYLSPSSTELDLPDVFDPVSQYEEMYQEGAGENLPVYELVAEAADGMEWTTNILYSFLMLVTAMALSVGVTIASGSVLLGVGACTIIMFAGVSTGVLALWIVLVYLLLALGYLVVARGM